MDANINLRIEGKTKKQFVKACENKGVPHAFRLRELIKADAEGRITIHKPKK